MKEHEFYFPIGQEYFPAHKITKQPHARVFYTADSLDNITITWVAMGPSVIGSIWRFSQLIIDIEHAAKDHYHTLGIEQPEYNDTEMQEKHFS
jgi:hypothetical protein